MVLSSGDSGLLSVVGDEDVAVAVRPGRRDIMVNTDDFLKGRSTEGAKSKYVEGKSWRLKKRGTNYKGEVSNQSSINIQKIW